MGRNNLEQEGGHIVAIEELQAIMNTLKNTEGALVVEDLTFPYYGFRSKCTLKGGTKLHLGCGNLYQLGWTNIDQDLQCKADVYCELRVLMKDCGKETIDWIFADNVVEHLPQIDIVEFFRNIHKSLKPNGVFELIVPLFPTRSAVIDPTHLSYYVPETFLRFTKKFWTDIAQSNGYGFYFKLVHCLQINEREIYVRLEKE